MGRFMKKVQAVFTAIGAALSSFFGVLYVPVLLMVGCNVIDYVTGLMASHARGDAITSNKGLRGISKKICMWLLVVVGAMLDSLIVYATAQLGINYRFNFLVACVVVIWIICNEIISILENIADIGVQMPKFLMRIVTYIQAKTEEVAQVPGTDNTDDADDKADTKADDGDASKGE